MSDYEEMCQVVEIEPNIFIPSIRLKRSDGSLLDTIDFWLNHIDFAIDEPSWDVWTGQKSEFKRKVWICKEIDDLVPWGVGPLKLWDIKIPKLQHSFLSHDFKFSENENVNNLMILSELKLIPFKIYQLSKQDIEYGFNNNHFTDKFITVKLFVYGFNSICFADIPYNFFLNANFRLLKEWQIHPDIIKILPNSIFRKGKLDDIEKLMFLEKLFVLKIKYKKKLQTNN